MPFNPQIKKKIVVDKSTGKHHPCVMCGITYPAPQAAHIVDEKEWKLRHGGDKQLNGMPLCPNCHWVFESILRPRLYQALHAFGTKDLPESWKKNNKISHVEKKAAEILGVQPSAVLDVALKDKTKSG